METPADLSRLYENLTLIFELTEIPMQVREFTTGGQHSILFSIPDFPEMQQLRLPSDLEKKMPALLERIKDETNNRDFFPLIHSDENRAISACFPLSLSGPDIAEKNLYAVTIGPCYVPSAFGSGDERQMTEQRSTDDCFRECTENERRTIERIVPYRELRYVYAAIRLAYRLVTGESIDLSDLLMNNADHDAYRDVSTRTGEMLLARREEVKFHMPYSTERELWDFLRRGAIDQVRLRMETTTAWGFGIIGKTNLRHEKNMLIASTTLATRAAIDGGVPDEIAYAMSDSVISSGEELASTDSVLLLKNRMLADFTELVIRYKKETRYSREVARCIDYISKFLLEDITLERLSAVVNLSPSQISRKFKKETGTSIVDYIQNERVTEATNMLRFSSRSLPDIANSLNFASQSYFTAVFKRHTKMTPAEYRRKNG